MVQFSSQICSHLRQIDVWLYALKTLNVVISLLFSEFEHFLYVLLVVFVKYTHAHVQYTHV